MKTVSVKILEQLPPAIEDKMQADLVKYEKSHGVEVNYKTFSFVMMNHQEEVIGAINAYSVFAEIYIDDIWVDHLHRFKGYGKKLITPLENHFKDQKFNNINLVTNQFQAPEFYKKMWV